MIKIITRIAPAPTGKLHIGNVRVALFNYLFAKKNKGEFILRIEDTDKTRSKVEYEKDILENFTWLEIIPDKIYKQSERFDIYEQYLKKLLEKNLAYNCYCNQEELIKDRELQKEKGFPLIYSGKCANLKSLKNLSDYVVRLRSNHLKEKEIFFSDLLRGKISIKTNLVGDFIIAKVKNNKIYPLYNLAVVVDDYEMKITHIIRGEEHIPNTPKQILIQKALNFATPQYLHLPLILNPDKSKMSKREGAASLSLYKEDGYLKNALINFIAFLGWNPKDKREFFSIEDLINEFSIKNIQKSGAIFNIEKLDYINGYYIRKKDISELTNLCLPYLIQSQLIELVEEKKDKKYIIKKNNKTIQLEYIKKIIKIYQERLKKLSEIGELTDYFFTNELSYQKEMFLWKDSSYENTIKSLKFTKKIIYDKIDEESFVEDKIKTRIFDIIPSFNKSIGLSEKMLKDKGYILWPFRVSMTAKKASSGPFEIAEILGKKETIRRIDMALDFLKN